MNKNRTVLDAGDSFFFKRQLEYTKFLEGLPSEYVPKNEEEEKLRGVNAVACSTLFSSTIKQLESIRR